MDSEGRIIEVVLGTEFSDYDRRTGDNKTRPRNWCRQFARNVSVYDSLDRHVTASERTASILNISLNKHLIILVLFSCFVVMIFFFFKLSPTQQVC